MSMLKRTDEGIYQVYDHGIPMGTVVRSQNKKWQIQGRDGEFHSRTAATVSLITGEDQPETEESTE